MTDLESASADIGRLLPTGSSVGPAFTNAPPSANVAPQKYGLVMGALPRAAAR